MILNPNHLADLWNLYQKALPADDGAIKSLSSLDHDRLVYALFHDKIVFGSWHDGRLISSVTLGRTKIPNLLISEKWLTDRHYLRDKHKLESLREGQNYAWDNHCRILRIIKTRLLDKTVRLHHQFDLSLRKYQVIDRIAAGSLSRYDWINSRYFTYGPPAEEWSIMLSD